MRRGVVLGTTMVCLITLFVLVGEGSPDLSQGVQVLSMLADPYGANTYLIKDQFERLGWDVTFTGINRSVRACSTLCSTFFADLVVEDIETSTDYDVLVVMPTPGTFRRKPNPVGDLRDSELAVNLVQEAFAGGLTLYAGCSGILLFGDAGCLEGANVLSHRNRAVDCRSFDANCTLGSASTPPMIDGQLVTATNQRVWPIEIAAAIARSLDLQYPSEPSLDSIVARDLRMTAAPVESPEADIRAWTLGTTLADLGRDVCAVADGSILVGMTYSSDGREDILIVRRDSAGDIVWAKAIGGPGRDFAEAVCESPDGWIYATGYTTSAGNGLEDALILKLTADGELEWVTTVGGADYDAAFDICPAGGDGAVICGLTYSSGAGLSDLYVVKVSAEGTISWQRTFGGEKIERGESIQPLADGGYVVGGGTSSIGAGNLDMYVVRLNSTGREIWANAYGRATYDIANSVIALQDGGFLITGHGDKEGSEVMALTVVRIDDEGNENWTSRFGSGRDFDYGLDAVELDAGGYLIAGVTNEPDPGENDIWLHIINETGNSTKQYTFGGIESEWPGGLYLDSRGIVILAGQTASYGQGGHDALILELTLP